MTASRLNAQQLDITQAEYDALIWVRDAIDPEISDHDLPAWMRFDMNNWGYVKEKVPLNADHCGTACCIGGSMEMHLAGLTSKPGDYRPTLEEAYELNEAFTKVSGLGAGSKSLYSLFFDYPSEGDYRTRPLAVEAIDRFLAGNIGNPWQLPGIDD